MRAAVANDPQQAAIHHVSSELTTLAGVPARVVRELGAVRIEVDITEALQRHWEQLLALLAQGFDFGLTDTDTGQVAWLRIEAGETFRS
ncbi:hypothetical protein OIB37_12620 [Streptomyces sp. NBC_00820]|uniref:hypothetical protein n=1 Tax=Streptomyces sp. NBC_00820 TaxID=2975842 RepID=UPI002ED0478F|nr:hypothetical protein OIB37_12620 [Streptomyces sp. NBC_00820]